jgi:hypothetical protein
VHSGEGFLGEEIATPFSAGPFGSLWLACKGAI